MKKYIYGIIDTRTSNFGDICLLDRDEEFRDGCVGLFTNPDIPVYIVQDLVAVCYGFISCDSDDLYPDFHLLDQPRVILFGKDCISIRKESDSDEENL